VSLLLGFQLKCDGTGREVEGKLANGVGSLHTTLLTYTTSEHGVSTITTADAQTSAVSSRLN